MGCSVTKPVNQVISDDLDPREKENEEKMKNKDIKVDQEQPKLVTEVLSSDFSSFKDNTTNFLPQYEPSTLVKGDGGESSASSVTSKFNSTSKFGSSSFTVPPKFGISIFCKEGSESSSSSILSKFGTSNFSKEGNSKPNSFSPLQLGTLIQFKDGSCKSFIENSNTFSDDFSTENKENNQQGQQRPPQQKQVIVGTTTFLNMMNRSDFGSKLFTSPDLSPAEDKNEYFDIEDDQTAASSYDKAKLQQKKKVFQKCGKLQKRIVIISKSLEIKSNSKNNKSKQCNKKTFYKSVKADSQEQQRSKKFEELTVTAKKATLTEVATPSPSSSKSLSTDDKLVSNMHINMSEHLDFKPIHKKQQQQNQNSKSSEKKTILNKSITKKKKSKSYSTKNLLTTTTNQIINEQQQSTPVRKNQSNRTKSKSRQFIQKLFEQQSEYYDNKTISKVAFQTIRTSNTEPQNQDFFLNNASGQKEKSKLSYQRINNRMVNGDDVDNKKKTKSSKKKRDKKDKTNKTKTKSKKELININNSSKKSKKSISSLLERRKKIKSIQKMLIDFKK